MRQTGQVPPQLVPVDCPDEVKYLWEYWMSMHQRRHQNVITRTTGKAIITAVEPLPISNSEMDAWARLHAIQLVPFEVDLLDRIESLYFKTRKT